MIKVYYFSGSGKSRRLAEFFADELSAEIFDITKQLFPENYYSETSVIVFPVYCQNLPEPIIDFIPKLKTDNIVYIATYGKKSYGNVIADAAKLCSATFIGGACVPCGHSFLNEPDDFPFESMKPIIERIKSPAEAFIKNEHKDFYADLIPAKRTQLCVKLIRSDKCTNCGKCIENCPIGSMKEYKPDKNCIRCLLCVKECPQKALSFKVSSFLNIYLRNNRKNELKFYL